MNETISRTAVQVVETCGVDTKPGDVMLPRESLAKLQVPARSWSNYM